MFVGVVCEFRISPYSPLIPYARRAYDDTFGQNDTFKCKGYTDVSNAFHKYIQSDLVDWSMFDPEVDDYLDWIYLIVCVARWHPTTHFLTRSKTMGAFTSGWLSIVMVFCPREKSMICVAVISTRKGMQ